MQLLKWITSWLAVLVGLCVSVVIFGLFGALPLMGTYGPPSLRMWVGALSFLLSGITAAAASLIAFRNRKLASVLCLIAAPLMISGTWFSQMSVMDALGGVLPGDQPSIAASVAPALVPLILLGYFWSVAQRYHWSLISAGTKLPRWAKLAFGAAASALFFVCVCATSVRVAQLWTDMRDCGNPPPFANVYPHHAVFIARVVHFDRITGAMAIVQQRFGGIPRWNEIVFLKYVEKGTWFVNGEVEDGIVTRWLFPVFDLKCSGSEPIQDAGVELRLFRDSPNWEGVRIIGTVQNRPLVGGPASGVAVVVEGPEGAVATTTDRDGIYDVSGLPPGHYSIRVPTSRRHGTCQTYGGQGLNSGDVWGCELFNW